MARSLRTSLGLLAVLLPVHAGEPASPDYLEGLLPLTATRISMNKAVVTRCSIDAVLLSSPHASADMIVYANKALLDYLKSEPTGLSFPVGTVLLKEKYPPDRPKAKPVLITKMERVSAKGEIADWKFSVQSLTEEKRHGSKDSLARCQTCHEDYEETSFVSQRTVELLRTYMTSHAKKRP